jgi:hypothetical protein
VAGARRNRSNRGEDHGSGRRTRRPHEFPVQQNPRRRVRGRESLDPRRAGDAHRRGPPGREDRLRGSGHEGLHAPRGGGGVRVRSRPLRLERSGGTAPRRRRFRRWIGVPKGPLRDGPPSRGTRPWRRGRR